LICSEANCLRASSRDFSETSTPVQLSAARTLCRIGVVEPSPQPKSSKFCGLRPRETRQLLSHSTRPSAKYSRLSPEGASAFESASSYLPAYWSNSFPAVFNRPPLLGTSHFDIRKAMAPQQLFEGQLTVFARFSSFFLCFAGGFMANNKKH